MSTPAYRHKTLRRIIRKHTPDVTVLDDAEIAARVEQAGRDAVAELEASWVE